MAATISLHVVAEPRAPASADVIFVHGLGGDCISTWSPVGRPELYWPRWVADELPTCHVRSLGYPAGPTHWSLAASDMGLIDRAKNLLEYLTLNGVGALPTYFIGYSLGGLLVKQMLCCAATLGIGKWRPIVEQTRGVVFLATPHTGSSLSQVATLLAPVSRPTAATRDLAAESEFLRQLNDWFRQYALGSNLAVEAYSERQKMRGVYIVDPSSANPGVGGCVPVAVDADHVSIAKPSDPSDIVVKGVTAFLRRFTEAPQTPRDSAATPVRFKVVFREMAVRDCETADLRQDRLREFFDREFEAHPNIFLATFVSRPFMLHNHAAFCSFDGALITVERVAAHRFHPLTHRWSALLAQYKRAHAMPYRRAGAMPTRNFKAELIHFKSMTAGIAEYLADYHESFGVLPDPVALDDLLMEAEIYSIDDAPATISALESILSNIHKLLLSTIPHAPLSSSSIGRLLEEKPRREREGEGVNVLIMDDEPMVLLSVEDIVEDYAPGWKSLLCETTTEAFAHLINDEIDIFIADLNMSGLSGLNVVEAFRKASPNTLIIVHTGYGDAIETSGVATAKLAKPSRQEDWRRVFEQILSIRPELRDKRALPS